MWLSYCAQWPNQKPRTRNGNLTHIALCLKNSDTRTTQRLLLTYNYSYLFYDLIDENYYFLDRHKERYKGDVIKINSTNHQNECLFIRLSFCSLNWRRLIIINIKWDYLTITKVIKTIFGITWETFVETKTKCSLTINNYIFYYI